MSVQFSSVTLICTCHKTDHDNLHNLVEEAVLSAFY